MIATNDLHALIALAEKATPGPWQIGYRDGSGKFKDACALCAIALREAIEELGQ